MLNQPFRNNVVNVSHGIQNIADSYSFSNRYNFSHGCAFTWKSVRIDSQVAELTRIVLVAAEGMDSFDFFYSRSLISASLSNLMVLLPQSPFFPSGIFCSSSVVSPSIAPIWFSSTPFPPSGYKIYRFIFTDKTLSAMVSLSLLVKVWGDSSFLKIFLFS